MRIAILNYSGNVGKTTIARDIFSYQLQDHELINIESVNNDGKETMVIRGEDGDQLYTEIMVNDDLILDIGSSNLEAFFRTSDKESEIIESMDIFVIPVTPEKKQQFDTIKTIQDLLKMKVKPGAIHVVCNQVIDDPMTPIEEVFDKIIEGASRAKINLDTDNVIYKHDLYNSGLSLREMIRTEDFRAMMEEAKKAGDKEKAREFAKKHIRQRKVSGLLATYEKIFKKIYGKTK